MPAATTTDEFVDLLRRSQLVEPFRLDGILNTFDSERPAPRAFAEVLVRQGVLTPFQASLLLAGKWRGFLIAGGKYKLLQLLGIGGMGKVYLCEHVRMKRLVALKVLPPESTKDRSSVERFNREAVAAGALNHPNIVRAFDVDQDGELHFLVMEYVDGSSLQEIVRRRGPLDIGRACHYVSQAAHGLQHAHEAGWVHRDIKPGNLLLDRAGAVRILDMGLARLFHTAQGQGLTEKYDNNAVLGTADYLAPEQAVNSTDVDIRADVYSLGATLYYLLTGRPPFDQGTIAEKLLAHQMKDPESVTRIRPEIPKSLEVVIKKMMAKKPVHRYQSPLGVIEALEPWTQVPIEPPGDDEMPRLCSALEGYAAAGAPASGVGLGSSGRLSPRLPPVSSGYLLRNGVPDQLIKRRRTSVRQTAAGAVLGLFILSGSVASWNWLTTPVSTPKNSATASRPPRENVTTPAVASPLPAGPAAPRAAIPAEPAVTGTIVVSRDARPELLSQGPVVTSLLEAVEKAGPGQRILVMDANVSGNITISDPARLQGLLIESGLPAGKKVEWLPGRDASPNRPLVEVSNVNGVRLRGFAFGGDGRVGTLIRLVGSCRGARLENLQLSQFKREGLELFRSPGELDTGVLVQNVRFLTVPEYAAPGRERSKDVRPAALTMSAESAGAGGGPGLSVRECRFEGLYQSAVRLDGPVYGEFERNRLFTLRDDERPKAAESCDAFLVRGGAARLLLRHNTAARYTVFLRLESLPPAGSGARFELRSNLMAGGSAWVMPPGGGDDTSAAPLFAGSAGNVCRPGTCSRGIAAVPRTTLTFDYLQVGGDNATFLRYPMDAELSRAGAGGEPAGYPPD